MALFSLGFRVCCKEVPSKPIQGLFLSFAGISAKVLAESFLNLKSGTISTWEVFSQF